MRRLIIKDNEFTGPISESFVNMQTNDVYFEVDHNNFDRDSDGEVHLSPALQTRYDSLVPHNNNN